MVKSQPIIDTVKKARSVSTKRKFKQSFELVINLKDIDVKKNQLNVNETIFLPNPPQNTSKVCVIASGDLSLRAGKSDADQVLEIDKIDEISGDKRSARKIVNSYDFFLAETSAMSKIGKVLGKFLGPKGRMPLPITQTSPIENMISKYKTAVRIRGRTLSLATKLGDEDMDDEKIAENALSVINTVTSKLPNNENNLKGFVIKLSMSPPVRISAQEVS